MKRGEFRVLRRLLQALQQSAPETEGKLVGTYQAFTANLYNFLPDISPNKYSQLFQRMILYQQLSLLDQHDANLLEKVTLDTDQPGCVDRFINSPCVIGTFHSGSYRAINLLLAKYQRPFRLLVSDQVLKVSGSVINSLQKKLYGESDFGIINASGRQSGLEMARSLREGKSIVIYLDGNEGLQQHANSRQVVPVSFLGKPIHVRSGAANLANLGKVPFITAICHRDQHDAIRIGISETGKMISSDEKKQQASILMQDAWQQFGRIISRYPAQWEGWQYIHRLLRPGEGTHAEANILEGSGNGLTFNRSRYNLFTMGTYFFIFDKANYRTFPISEKLYVLLTDSIDTPIRTQQVTPLRMNSSIDTIGK